MVQDMLKAQEQEDPRRMWKLLKAIGGRGRGPKRMSLVVGQVDKPSRENWAWHLSKRGWDGGCSAVEVEGGSVGGTERDLIHEMGLQKFTMESTMDLQGPCIMYTWTRSRMRSEARRRKRGGGNGCD